MLAIDYYFSQHYKIRFDVTVINVKDDAELIEITDTFYQNYLDLMYVPDEVFTMNIEDEIFTQHYFIVSCTHFKYNYRYYGSVMADDKMIIYYSGRELTLQETKQGNRVHRPKVSIDEVILKTIFAGLNSYKVLESENVVHFLKFSPVFLYYYKHMLSAIKFFFELNELSLRFIYLRFKESLHVFKKIRSIKKNLKKKNYLKSKNDDYTLVNL